MVALVEKDEAGRLKLDIIYDENEEGSDSSEAKGEKFIVQFSSLVGRANECSKVHDI